MRWLPHYPWKKHALRLVFLVCLVALCFLPMLVSKWVADAHGCQLHEGFVTPCLVAGMDVGALLYQLFVSGWLAVFAVVVGFYVLIAFLFAAAFDVWVSLSIGQDGVARRRVPKLLYWGTVLLAIVAIHSWGAWRSHTMLQEITNQELNFL